MHILGSTMVNPIVVVEYDPSWPELFQSLRKRISAALGSLATVIEHVGSTAVPGLAAKPIIDIDVLLASAHLLPLAIEHLASLGYVHQGNLGIPEREAFLAPASDAPHRLYVCPPCSHEFRKPVAFRDYLRSHPNEAQRYGELKRTLAIEFRENRAAYVAGKTDFVEEIIGHAIVFSERFC